MYEFASSVKEPASFGFRQRIPQRKKKVRSPVRCRNIALQIAIWIKHTLTLKVDNGAVSPSAWVESLRGTITSSSGMVSTAAAITLTNA